MKTVSGLIRTLAVLGLGLGLLAPHAMAAEPKPLEPVPAKR